MEKVIMVYDISSIETSGIVGLIIVDELELGYIKDKIIIFSDKEIKRPLFDLLSSFDKRYINIKDINKSGNELGKNFIEDRNICFIDPFPLKSKNKNKSSRYKRMLERMNLSHFERNDYIYGR